MAGRFILKIIIGTHTYFSGLSAMWEIFSFQQLRHYNDVMEDTTIDLFIELIEIYQLLTETPVEH